MSWLLHGNSDSGYYWLLNKKTTSSLSNKRQDSSSPSKKSVSLSFNKTVVAPEGEISVSNTLRAFSYHDLKNAAKNFRSDSLLGEGGFGWVYKAWKLSRSQRMACIS
ncbi:hypothetical protein POM88_001401 [Heracleum sosnowskyi]|uniref:Uncharacterized protein n=1 Tax=Heracleum sosnowskyi TaxID=360622 RepID=A0AAD8JDM3_9APIA|nr:hypothetical protein POM88_001401 [Heracleum sosnowskyi]